MLMIHMSSLQGFLGVIAMDSHDVIQQLQSYRIILTATAGRTGTLLLSKLMSLVPGVYAEHEPPPRIDNVWWRAKNDPKLYKTWLVRHKLPSVLQSLQQHTASVYIETSHMLCKGFLEPLLDLGIKPDLIVLSRDHRATAMSLYSLASIPMRTKSGRRWLLSPRDETNISSLPPLYSQWSDYQLAYWYVLEMSLRSERYLKSWLWSRITNIDLKHLVEKSGFRSLLQSLDLQEPPTQAWHEYKLLTMTKHNEKSTTKSFVRNRNMEPRIVQDIENQELMVREAIKYEDLLQSIRQD